MNLNIEEVYVYISLINKWFLYKAMDPHRDHNGQHCLLTSIKIIVTNINNNKLMLIITKQVINDKIQMKILFTKIFILSSQRESFSMV